MLNVTTFVLKKKMHQYDVKKSFFLLVLLRRIGSIRLQIVSPQNVPYLLL